MSWLYYGTDGKTYSSSASASGSVTPVAVSQASSLPADTKIAGPITLAPQNRDMGALQRSLGTSSRSSLKPTRATVAIQFELTASSTAALTSSIPIFSTLIATPTFVELCSMYSYYKLNGFKAIYNFGALTSQTGTHVFNVCGAYVPDTEAVKSFAYLLERPGNAFIAGDTSHNVCIVSADCEAPEGSTSGQVLNKWQDVNVATGVQFGSIQFAGQGTSTVANKVPVVIWFDVSFKSGK